MDLWRNRLFLKYIGVVSFSNFGYTLYMITIPAYSFLLGGGIIFTGLTLFVEYGIFTLTFLFGSIVDRVRDKRYIIVGSEMGLFITALVMGLFILSKSSNHVIFLILVSILAIFWDIIWAADYAVIPLIVSKEDIGSANGYVHAIGSSHMAAGLAVGGFLFIVLGPYGSIILYSICMLCSGILSSFIPLVIEKKSKKHSEGFLYGWKYVFTENRTLLTLSLVLIVFSFFSIAPVEGITDIFISNSSFWYSVVYSSYFVGSIITGIILGRFFPKRNIGKVLIASLAATGILMLLSVNALFYYPLDLVVWLLLGFNFSVYSTLYSSYLQNTTEKELIGRTASNLYLFRGISAAVGAISLPFFISEYGVLTSFEYFGSFIIAATLAVVIFIPSIRNMTITSHPCTRISE